MWNDDNHHCFTFTIKEKLITLFSFIEKKDSIGSQGLSDLYYVMTACSCRGRWRYIIVQYFLLIFIVLTFTMMISITLYEINKKRKEKKHSKMTNKWRAYLDSLLTNEDLEILTMQPKYYEKLHSSEELIAFLAASREYNHSPNTENDKFRQFIHENKNHWISLGGVYGKKRSIAKAYFAYVCEQLGINNSDENDEMTKIMMEYALEPSIYCRENALKALYAFGNIDAVVEVFIKLSKNNRIHHRKLVTDGLLEFKGNQTDLAESLYHHFDKFNPEYQVAMIDFFRFSGKQLKKKLIELLKQKNVDKDIICATLRYYHKYPHQEYKRTILSYLHASADEEWECVSTAALTLGKYPGEDTIYALKSVLTSKYWYVRLNAARSIAELGVEEDKLTDVLQGEDFYAKEQLIYHITNRKETRLQDA